MYLYANALKSTNMLFQSLVPPLYNTALQSSTLLCSLKSSTLYIYLLVSGTGHTAFLRVFRYGGVGG